MKVTLEKKRNGKKDDKNATISLRLVYTLGGKRYRKSTGLILEPGKDVKTRTQNHNKLEIAAVMRADKELALARNKTSIGNNRSDIDFVEYYKAEVEKYKNSDRSKHNTVRDYFIDFLSGRKITGAEVTPGLCEDFGAFIKTKPLTGETPHAYFGTFRRYIKRAYKDKVINFHPEDIEIKFKFDRTAIRKQILTLQQTKLMESAPCNMPEVKAAFLFCLQTGIDHRTVSVITDKNIIDDELVFMRSKTQIHIKIPLTDKAKEIVRGRKGRLFDIPGWRQSVYYIRKMAEAVNIPSGITWHTARHTFGYLAINEYGIPREIIADIMGHQNVRTTARYSKINSDTKRAALEKMN